MAKRSKAVAKTAAGAAAIPDWMKDHQGAGQEDIGRDDIAMPRLKLGQAMSPEVKDKKAEEGDLIHNITQEVLCASGDTIRIIPIAYSKEFIIWYDRKGPHGGGIAARARKCTVEGAVRYMWDKPNSTITDKVAGVKEVTYVTKRFIDEDGLAEWGSQNPDDPSSPPAATEHHNYVVMLPDNENQLVALSLSKTAGKKAKEFNTMLKMGTAPTFGRIYKLGSYIDSRDDDTFANYQFTGFEMIDDPVFGQELADMHYSLKDKGINVDFSDDDGTAPEGSKDKDGKF